MIEIKKRQNISNILSSLERAFNIAKINGVLKYKDIYYLNLIYNLIKTQSDFLDDVQIRKLTDTYNRFLYCSPNICQSKVIKQYQTTPIKRTEQAEKTDCNNAPLRNVIYYWQNDGFFNIEDYEDIETYFRENPVDLSDKLFKTHLEFEQGVDIINPKIGNMFFLITNENNGNFNINDILGNEVSDFFHEVQIPHLNYRVMFSHLMYTPSLMKLKIKRVN